MTELRFLFLSESQTLLFYFLELPICQVIGCDGAQVKAESLFYWVSPSSFLRNFRLFFLSLRVYYSFRLICILIWELFAFLLLDTEQIVTQEAYESWLTPITLPPNKNNHFPSNYETEQLAVCSLGPGGRQHHYLHRFDYAAAGRVTLSALESNVCWLCIMSKSEAERLLFKSYVTH